MAQIELQSYDFVLSLHNHLYLVLSVKLKLFELESKICVELLSKKELIFQHSELYRATVARIMFELFSYLNDRDLATTGLRSAIGQTKSERVEFSKVVAATLEGLELQAALDYKYLTCLKVWIDNIHKIQCCCSP